MSTQAYLLDGKGKKLNLGIDPATYGLKRDKDKEGFWWLEFSDVDAENLKFEAKFGDRAASLLADLKAVVGAPALNSPSDGSQAVKT